MKTIPPQSPQPNNVQLVIASVGVRKLSTYIKLNLRAIGFPVATTNSVLTQAKILCVLL
jgi:hypothetical protein